MDTAVKTATRQATIREATRRRAWITGGGLAAFLAASHTATDTFSGMFAALLPALQGRPRKF